MSQIEAEYEAMETENYDKSEQPSDNFVERANYDKSSYVFEQEQYIDIEDDVIVEDVAIVEDFVTYDISLELAAWSVQHKLTRAATNDLLGILNKHGHNLPKDQRTLQKIPSKIVTVKKVVVLTFTLG